MNNLLIIDKHSGRIARADGVVVFDPNVGPVAARLNSAQVLFEGTADDQVQLSVSYVEINGGYLSFFADHPKFGTSWDDWTEQKERSRVNWLAEYLKSCGTPVGSYPWGKVEALYDAKGGLALAMGGMRMLPRDPSSAESVRRLSCPGSARRKWRKASRNMANSLAAHFAVVIYRVT